MPVDQEDIDTELAADEPEALPLGKSQQNRAHNAVFSAL